MGAAFGWIAQAAKRHMIPPVLLAEDDENDVLLIKRAFEKSRLVNSLQVACDRERYPMPVAMLLDLKLPRKSGLEVLAWVKQQPGLKRMPIIVLTSSREARDVQQAYDLGSTSTWSNPSRRASSPKCLHLQCVLARTQRASGDPTPMNHGKDRHAAGAYPPSESFAQNAAKARIVIVDDDESIALLAGDRWTGRNTISTYVPAAKPLSRASYKPGQMSSSPTSGCPGLAGSNCCGACAEIFQTCLWSCSPPKAAFPMRSPRSEEH